MRLGLVLGYGDAFGVESVQWGGGRGVPPPPFKRLMPWTRGDTGEERAEGISWSHVCRCLRA